MANARRRPRAMSISRWLQLGAATAAAGAAVAAAQSTAHADSQEGASGPASVSISSSDRPVRTALAPGKIHPNSPNTRQRLSLSTDQTPSRPKIPTSLRRAAGPAATAQNLGGERQLPAPVAEAIATTNSFIDTYVNLDEWWNGSFIVPAAIRHIFFNQTPVANPMNVETDLARGITSTAIPFIASDSDSDPLIYSVPSKGSPGGPTHGTVSVDRLAGTFTYTPDEDFSGTDSFAFIVSDDTTPHVHAWEDLFNAAFGILNTGLAGGHRTTATVTIFNNIDVRPADGPPPDITGNLRVLTYNVAGQPFPLSGGALPRIPNMLEIGSLINNFDIVNVQQDVAYHSILITNATFPDQTPPEVPTWLWPTGIPFTDGLNSFAAYDIESLNRQKWADCATTCPAPMGFTYSRMHIPGGSSIDVYNVDSGVDSGVDSKNVTWSHDDITQLSNFIQLNSVGRAVIVTGNFGQLYSDPDESLTQFTTVNGLTDAWVQLQYNGITPVDAATCAYANSCEQPDKIFYRDAAPLASNDPSTSPVRLQAQVYTNEGLTFRNAFGQDLSDHQPQSVIFSYSVDSVGPMNVDLANWMANMPALSNLPLTQLPIPGTHDSGTYGISAKSQWARTGDEEYGELTKLPEFLQDLVVKPIVAGWARTQSKNLYEQLNDGIRYVDLRLSNEPDGQIYIEHALRGPQIDEVIDDISRFVHEHPKEMVIVYAQGFTNFTAQTHAEFVSQLQAAFGDRMAPRSLTTATTLADLWAIDKNVVVVYNNANTVAGDELLWYDSTLYRPWPDVPSMDQLFTANQENLASRPTGSIWGLFGEPTEDANNVIMGIALLGPTSERHYISNTHPTVQQWLRANFKSTVNLVTDDWYQQDWPVGSRYARDVISAVYETMGTGSGSAS